MCRILALHGAGTNAAILESQLAAVRAQLPSHWEWVFPQAEHICDASPGVEIWPGPYRNYFLVPTVDAMADAYEWLNDVIENEGPFEGVIGFSEGGALAAGALLRHQIMNPYEPPLFRWAIFASSALPWVGNDEDGLDVTPIMMWRKQVPTAISDIRAKCAKLNAIPLPPLATIDVEEISPCVRRYVHLFDSVVEPYLMRTRRMHPEVDTVRLSVPTGHVLSKSDFAYEGGKLVRQLCDSGLATTMEHSAGHSIPRNVLEARKFRQLIEQTRAKADFVI